MTRAHPRPAEAHAHGTSLGAGDYEIENVEGTLAHIFGWLDDRRALLRGDRGIPK